MSAKLVLNMMAMQEEFFDSTALIGIASAMPGYRFCWLLNRHFNVDFVRQPDLDICLRTGNNQKFYFPIYQYIQPMSGLRHLLYKLKSNKESLLPEARQLDYLWLIQSNMPDTDAMERLLHLRNMPDIQLAQILATDRMKNLNNLLV